MTDETTFSFVYDRKAARLAFKGIGIRELVLANLAALMPQPSWEGCMVYEGQTPLDEDATVCIGCDGPCADEVQEKLAERFTGLGIPVLAAYEGGPEVRSPIAVARGGRWCEP
jgi:hypothetical protein